MHVLERFFKPPVRSGEDNDPALIEIQKLLIRQSLGNIKAFNLTDDRYNTSIWEILDIKDHSAVSNRIQSSLARFRTVGKVLEMSEEKLLGMEDFGPGQFEYLLDRLVIKGFIPGAGKISIEDAYKKRDLKPILTNPTKANTGLQLFFKTR